MKLNKYQDEVLKTIFPLQRSHNEWLIYCALKLCEETGEIAAKLGKTWRDVGAIENIHISTKKNILIKKELGDVLWYIALLANRLGWTLEEVAQANIDKIKDRALRGVVCGEGDER